MTTECPYCHQTVELPDDHDYDEDLTVYCEDCGEHPAERCPACGELIDLIYVGRYVP